MSISATAQVCIPSRLLLVPSIPRERVVEGWPVSIQVVVLDDCGDRVTTATVAATFSDGSSPISLLHVGNAVFAGTFIPRTRAEITVQFNASTANGSSGTAAMKIDTRVAPSFILTPALRDMDARIGEADTQIVRIEASDDSRRSLKVLEGIAAGRSDIVRVIPSSDVTPAELVIRFLPTADFPARASAVLRIDNFFTLPFTLTANPGRPPTLRVDRSAIVVTAAGGSGKETRQLIVTNDGPGEIDYAVSVRTSSGGEWLEVSPQSGSVSGISPATLTIGVDPSGVPTGAHSGRVTITSRATQSSVEVVVTLAVAGPIQNILLSQTGLSFTAVAGGGTDPPQTVGVLNTGEGEMRWQAAASTNNGGAAWLSVSPASGVSVGGSLQIPVVEVRVNASNLEPDTYFGQVEIRSTSALNHPQIVAVVVTVLPRGTRPPPFVRPTGLIFTGIQGGASVASQVMGIRNLGLSPVAFSSGGFPLEPGPTWFSHAPDRDFVAENGTREVTVSVSTTGLTSGIRRGFLTFGFGDASSRTVNLLLVLAPAGTRLSARHAAAEATEGCTPVTLAAEFVQLSRTFVVPAAAPAPIEALIVDNCTAPLVDGSVQVSFDNGDSPVELVSLGGGRWSGTWVPRQRSDRTVTARLSAETRDKTLRAEIIASGAVQAGADTPVVTSGSLVSAASLQSGVLPAPGGLVTIFGSALAEANNSAPVIPLPRDLAGTKVAIGGASLPLLYAGTQQINAQLPYDVPVNLPLGLTVRRGHKTSVPVTVTLASAEPAIFTVSGSGSGQAHAYYRDAAGGFRIADSGAPAPPGSVLEVYCTGLGSVVDPPEAGAPAPLDRFSPTVQPVTATIGGAAATVQFSGLVPGQIGLYQVNVQVPPGVTGNQVPLVLQMGNRTSPPVTIAVGSN